MSMEEDLRRIAITLARSEAKLDLIIDGMFALAKGELAVANELDTLKADVAQTQTVEESAIKALAGIKTALDAAIASGDPAQLTSLSSTLETENAALAAAIVANTPAAAPAPAAPAASEPPAPTPGS